MITTLLEQTSHLSSNSLNISSSLLPSSPGHTKDKFFLHSDQLPRWIKNLDASQLPPVTKQTDDNYLSQITRSTHCLRLTVDHSTLFPSPRICNLRVSTVTSPFNDTLIKSHCRLKKLQFSAHRSLPLLLKPWFTHSLHPELTTAAAAAAASNLVCHPKSSVNSGTFRTLLPASSLLWAWDDRVSSIAALTL